MAIDAVEVSSPPLQSQHFYLAVDRLQFKLETLVDLLGVAGKCSRLPIVVCCSSRDELDELCSAVSNLPCISLVSLYSDLAETERANILDKFRHAAMEWNQKVNVQSGNGSKDGKEEHKSHMIVVTDACLPLLTSGESPISARLLINYALPTKKVQLPLLF